MMPPEPARLRPNEPGWVYLGTLTNGTDVADHWQKHALHVISSVDFTPVPRRWEYHLSVHVEGADTPPGNTALANVMMAFKMNSARKERHREASQVVHLYART